MKQNKIFYQQQETPVCNGTGAFSSQNVRVACWNVDGIQNVLKTGDLIKCIEAYNPDVLFLNETHVYTYEAQELIQSQTIPKSYYQYQYFNCCVVKQFQYSGVCMFSKVEPISIQYEMGQNYAKHNGEGRIIAAEFQNFWAITAYVPNSGRGLARLNYRTQEWDPDFRQWLINLESKGKPII